MKKHSKRIMKLQYLAILFTLTIIFFFISNEKVFAAVQQKKPYLIKVNRVYNTITIYEIGETGEYDVPVKAMVCSVGLKGMQTKKGTFKTKEKYRWKVLKGDVWGQYSTRIVGGILFHSVYYYKSSNPATLATWQYNRLGSAASHGCIRLTVEDAKWIYDNCPTGTTVTIYDDAKKPGPLGKPSAIKLPSYVRWDPTDPSEKNPYRAKKPAIIGAKDITVTWGNEINLLKGVTAKSSVGLDITSKMKIDGTVDVSQPGEYDITYAVTDALGRSIKKTIKVTVNDIEEEPIFEGIEDSVVGADTIIDEEYVLTGVKVFCSKTRISIKKVKVTINKVSDTEYHISYYVKVGRDSSTTEEAVIKIDKEAPVFTGISDRKLEPGQIPDGTFALKDVTVSDNFTEMDVSDINVKINPNTDGTYTITYEALDKVGNIAKEEVKFYN